MSLIINHLRNPHLICSGIFKSPTELLNCNWSRDRGERTIEMSMTISKEWDFSEILWLWSMCVR